MARIDILKLIIAIEDDVVISRQRTRQIAEMLGFDQVDQIRLATAVSEIARNAYLYAGGGEAEYYIFDDPAKQIFYISIKDKGEGISDIEAAMQGKLKSKRGMGLGISGACKLVDCFKIDSSPEAGTHVLLGKTIPPNKTVTRQKMQKIIDLMKETTSNEPYEELKHQNKELANMIELINVQKDELIKANQVLRKQTKVFEMIQEAIVIVDTDDKIIDWNKGAEILFGFTREEAIGKSPIELYRPEMSEELRKSNLEKLFSIRYWQGQAPFTRKDGTKGISLTTAAPICNDNGEPIAYIGVSHDITELINAKECAEDANKAKSEFLANMSHELRTPMNAVIGISKMLQKHNFENLTPRQLEGLELISQSGNRLLDLINDLLDLAKIEAGKLEVENSVASLNVIITDIEKVVKSLMGDKNIKFWIKKDSNVPGLIYSDEKKIRQILINLLGNALKFTLKGEITLEVFVNQDRLYFVVKDTGIGIAGKDLDTIFEEFKQVDSSLTRKFKGTGLGLALSRKMVELLHGEIEITSIKDEGTTVSFYVPLVSMDTEKLSDLPGNINEPHETAKPATDLQPKKKVLIADDEELGRKTLELMLEKDYELIFAEDGKEAVEKFVSEKPDLVLLDIMMPVMDGYEAFTEINKQQKDSKIPVIAITARAMKDDKDKILAMGFDDYVSKPIDDVLLIRKIKNCIKEGD